MLFNTLVLLVYSFINNNYITVAKQFQLVQKQYHTNVAQNPQVVSRIKLDGDEEKYIK